MIDAIPWVFNYVFDKEEWPKLHNLPKETAGSTRATTGQSRYFLWLANCLALSSRSGSLTGRNGLVPSRMSKAVSGDQGAGRNEGWPHW